MTHHPIAQIALNGNLKSQEMRPRRCHFLRNRLLHSPRFATLLNVRAILHGRLVSLGGYGPAATIVGLFYILGLVVAPLLPQTDGKPLLEAMSPPLPARAG